MIHLAITAPLTYVHVAPDKNAGKRHNCAASAVASCKHVGKSSLGGTPSVHLYIHLSFEKNARLRVVNDITMFDISN